MRIDELRLPASLRGRRGLVDAIRAEIERALGTHDGSHTLGDVRVPAKGLNGATPDHRVAERVSRAVCETTGRGGA